MRSAVFVQVRIGSTRLPGKALLPLAGATVIGHVMRALRAVDADTYALLTDHASAHELSPLAAAEGFEVFAGSEEDVLARFCDAARSLAVQRILRATGDNPLTSAALARDIVDAHEHAGAHLSHYLGNPLGTGVEVVEASALYDAEKTAALKDEREHITTWIYRNRALYRVLEPQAPPEASLPKASVSIDTREDYERVQEIFSALYRGKPIETAELVRYLGGAVHA